MGGKWKDRKSSLHAAPATLILRFLVPNVSMENISVSFQGKLREKKNKNSIHLLKQKKYDAR